MIKVGILTFSFALNYGSLLQAYALQEILESQGYSACVIDLKEINEESRFSIKVRIRKRLIEAVSTLRFFPVIRKRNTKIEKFEAFRKKLNLTSKCCDIAGLQDVADNLDVIIVGSDQVWNTHLQDFTYLFLLPVANVRKIGYSVSLGKALEEDLMRYKEEIRDFDAISVREESSAQLVRTVFGRDVTVTLDPTLLIDVTTWNKISENTTLRYEQPFLLCFLFAKNREYRHEKYELVNSLAKRKGLKIIYLNHGYNRYSFDKDALCDCGIEDFLFLFKKADVVVTDSFHGTVFSIINHKDFYTVVDNNNTDKRKQNLLDKLGLGDRIIISEEGIRVQDKPIDYEGVERELCRLKRKSLDFFEKEIGSIYGRK